jgi:hypothetical protein
MAVFGTNMIAADLCGHNQILNTGIKKSTVILNVTKKMSYYFKKKDGKSSLYGNAS